MTKINCHRKPDQLHCSRIAKGKKVAIQGKGKNVKIPEMKDRNIMYVEFESYPSSSRSQNYNFHNQ